MYQLHGQRVPVLAHPLPVAVLQHTGRALAGYALRLVGAVFLTVEANRTAVVDGHFHRVAALRIPLQLAQSDVRRFHVISLHIRVVAAALNAADDDPAACGGSCVVEQIRCLFRRRKGGRFRLGTNLLDLEGYAVTSFGVLLAGAIGSYGQGQFRTYPFAMDLVIRDGHSLDRIVVQLIAFGHVHIYIAVLRQFRVFAVAGHCHLALPHAVHQLRLGHAHTGSIRTGIPVYLGTALGIVLPGVNLYPDLQVLTQHRGSWAVLGTDAGDNDLRFLRVRVNAPLVVLVYQGILHVAGDGVLSAELLVEQFRSVQRALCVPHPVLLIDICVLPVPIALGKEVLRFGPCGIAPGMHRVGIFTGQGQRQRPALPVGTPYAAALRSGLGADLLDLERHAVFDRRNRGQMLLGDLRAYPLPLIRIVGNGHGLDRIVAQLIAFGHVCIHIAVLRQFRVFAVAGHCHRTLPNACILIGLPKGNRRTILRGPRVHLPSLAVAVIRVKLRPHVQVLAQHGGRRAVLGADAGDNELRFLRVRGNAPLVVLIYQGILHVAGDGMLSAELLVEQLRPVQRALCVPHPVLLIDICVLPVPIALGKEVLRFGPCGIAPGMHRVGIFTGQGQRQRPTFPVGTPHVAALKRAHIRLYGCVPQLLGERITGGCRRWRDCTDQHDCGQQSRQPFPCFHVSYLLVRSTVTRVHYRRNSPSVM